MDNFVNFFRIVCEYYKEAKPKVKAQSKTIKIVSFDKMLIARQAHFYGVVVLSRKSESSLSARDFWTLLDIHFQIRLHGNFFSHRTFL